MVDAPCLAHPQLGFDIDRVMVDTPGLAYPRHKNNDGPTVGSMAPTRRPYGRPENSKIETQPQVDPSGGQEIRDGILDIGDGLNPGIGCGVGNLEEVEYLEADPC
jgi:hypothetical protein